MERRQFLGACSLAMGCLLGDESVDVLRNNAGVGITTAAVADGGVPPRAEVATGRVLEVAGSDVVVGLRVRGPLRSARLLVVRRTYPRGEVLSRERSDRVPSSQAGTTRTVRVSVPNSVPNEDGPGATGPWFYEVYLETADGLSGYLAESAPHRWRGRGADGAEPAQRVTDGFGPAELEGFVREHDCNDYVLRYCWRDSADRTWKLPYRLRRSVHEAAVERDRGYVRTFEESTASAVAIDLASAIATDARPDDGPADARNGRDSPSDGERFDRLVRFVQDLRYVRDAVSTDEYDYNRTVEETLVEGLGDCKDKTHLLAGLLAAPPLSCATAMLFQPGHVLLGVAAEDVPSRFDGRETRSFDGHAFLPIDPSLRFDVGEFADESVVAAYGDGEWLYWDLEAAGRGLDRNVRDWFSWNAGGTR